MYLQYGVIFDTDETQICSVMPHNGRTSLTPPGTVLYVHFESKRMVEAFWTGLLCTSYYCKRVLIYVE